MYREKKKVFILYALVVLVVVSLLSVMAFIVNNDGLDKPMAEAAVATNETTQYLYTGDVQTFTATKSGTYRICCYGASGGDTVNDSGTTSAGGNGAKTEGTIFLNSGTTLYIYVGQSGDNTSNATYNGGGAGGNWFRGKSGGGATDVRLINGAWDNFVV